MYANCVLLIVILLLVFGFAAGQLAPVAERDRPLVKSNRFTYRGLHLSVH